MSSETPRRKDERPQPEERPSKASVGRLLSVAAAVVAVIGGLVALGRFGYGEWSDWQDEQPDAEYERLEQLRAGIPLSQFQDILDEEDADVRRFPEGLIRHLYVRDYDYVLAVTDADQTVVSFSVMVREEDFHPTFSDRIVLGETTVASAWDTPGALAGVCGRPVQYFERSRDPSIAEPRVQALGVSGNGYVTESDLDLVCNADSALEACKSYLTGDAELAEGAAVDCFLNSAEGRTLREGLRPNVYAESAPHKPLLYEHLTLSDDEILSAEED